MTKRFDVIGLITIIVQSILHILHWPWLFWLAVEQFETGWGYGTNIEMLFLLPFLLQIFFFLPVALAAFGCIVFRLIKRNNKAFLITNISLWAAFALQIGLFYLFLLY